MLERYSVPEMKYIWSDISKYSNWLKIERALIVSLEKEDLIEPKEYEQLLKVFDFFIEHPEEIINESKKIEKHIHHDLAAFVDAISNKVNSRSSRWIHYGLTSSDVVDTAFSMQLYEAIDLLVDSLKSLLDILFIMANTYRDTPIMGRTHGIYAEPTTFGLILLNFHSELTRNLNRITNAKENIRLVRFNFNLLKKYFESFGVVVETVEDTFQKSYESELVEDMLSLMSSFSARIYGKRSAENRKKLKQSKAKTK